MPTRQASAIGVRAGNFGEAGHFLYGMESLWLPRSLLQLDRRAQLVDALTAEFRQEVGMTVCIEIGHHTPLQPNPINAARLSQARVDSRETCIFTTSGRTDRA